MRIEHVNIAAPAELLEKVKAFYCEIFDLAVRYRPSFTRAGYWLYAGSDPIIHLTVNDSDIRSRDTGYFDHFAIQATGMNDVIARLDALNIQYSIDHLQDIGVFQIFFRDPAGVGVEARFIDEQCVPGRVPDP